MISFFSKKREIDIVELEGPFIPEREIRVKNCKYKDILLNLNKSNLIIHRDFLVFTQNTTFQSRDNFRLELGLDHHNHWLEIIFKSYQDYNVLSIDNFVLLNSEDQNKINKYISNYLPSELELDKIKCIIT